MINQRDHGGLPGQELAEKIWQINLAGNSCRKAVEDAITYLERRLKNVDEKIKRTPGRVVTVRAGIELARWQLFKALIDIEEVLTTYLESDTDYDRKPSSRVLCLLTGELIRAEWDIALFESLHRPLETTDDKAKAPNNRL